MLKKYIQPTCLVCTWFPSNFAHQPPWTLGATNCLPLLFHMLIKNTNYLRSPQNASFQVPTEKPPQFLPIQLQQVLPAAGELAKDSLSRDVITQDWPGNCAGKTVAPAALDACRAHGCSRRELGTENTGGRGHSRGDKHRGAKVFLYVIPECLQVCLFVFSINMLTQTKNRGFFSRPRWPAGPKRQQQPSARGAGGLWAAMRNAPISLFNSK